MYSVGDHVTGNIIPGKTPANRSRCTMMQRRHRIHEVSHMVSTCLKGAIKHTGIRASVTNGDDPATLAELLNQV